jgi:uncharacterized protein (TIGR00162 family)
MTTRIVELSKPRIKNPVFIEGLPGVGNVGRIAGGYLVEQLKAVKFAELYSSHFMPFVILKQGATVHTLKNEFYYWKAKKAGQRDLVILIGDSQSINPEGHYETVNVILDYLERLKVKEMFTLAGLSIGEKKEKPTVVGAVSDESLIKKYSKFGIDFDAGENIGTIVGASGLLVGMGKERGMNGVCLLGETSGMPLLPDHKAAEQVLEILTKILKLKIDLKGIEKKVKEMEKFVKRIEGIQRKALLDMMKQKIPSMGKEPKGEGEEEGEDDLSYIG